VKKAKAIDDPAHRTNIVPYCRITDGNELKSAQAAIASLAFRTSANIPMGRLGSHRILKLCATPLPALPAYGERKALWGAAERDDGLSG
jgi:hypothetical protein